jgi:hypothetical protein
VESQVLKINKLWFPNEEFPSWDPVLCNVHFHETGEIFSAKTGYPKAAPGFAVVTADRDHDWSRICERAIHVRLDHPTTFQNILPHELTHAVVAGRFGCKAIPRWADEGMASLSETEEKLKTFWEVLARKKRFPVTELIEIEQYPRDKDEVALFYTQSIALTAFLAIEKGTPEKFTKFVRTSLEKNFSKALKEIYQITSEDLQTQYSNYLEEIKKNGFSKTYQKWKTLQIVNEL